MTHSWNCQTVRSMRIVFAGAAASAGRHAARLFYRAVVGIPSDRNWRYQLAGGINLMAARHRSSSLLARRNAFDTGALGVDYRCRRYRRHYLNTLSAAATPGRSSPFPIFPRSALFPTRVSTDSVVVAVSSSLQLEQLAGDNKLNRISRTNKLTLY